MQITLDYPTPLDFPHSHMACHGSIVNVALLLDGSLLPPSYHGTMHTCAATSTRYDVHHLPAHDSGWLFLLESSIRATHAVRRNNPSLCLSSPPTRRIDTLSTRYTGLSRDLDYSPLSLALRYSQILQRKEASSRRGLQESGQPSMSLATHQSSTVMILTTMAYECPDAGPSLLRAPRS